jgi:hypothetical protein
LLDALVHRFTKFGLGDLFIYGRGYKAFVQERQRAGCARGDHGLLQDANTNMTRHSPN